MAIDTLHIKPFAELSAAELLGIIEAREEVFYLEQHITEVDADECDLHSVHLWIRREGRVAAYARVIPAGVHYPEASIGRLLCRSEYRRQGLANKIMDAALEYIVGRLHEQSIRISAQSYLVPYYTAKGFRCISEPYLEAGISHRAMLYEAPSPR